MFKVNMMSGASCKNPPSPDSFGNRKKLATQFWRIEWILKYSRGEERHSPHNIIVSRAVTTTTFGGNCVGVDRGGGRPVRWF